MTTVEHAAVPLPSEPGPAGPKAQVSVLPFLEALAELEGSDLHCRAGGVPRIRMDGNLRRLRSPELRASDTAALLAEIIPADLREQFARTHEADFAYSLPGVGRFRVNAYRARGAVGMVIRRVPVDVLALDDLGLPEVLASLSMEPRGLVLVTGPTGSGKTTTLAAMVDHINAHRDAHVVTIEDPIEVEHVDKRSMISQREVRTDTEDVLTALRASMRQDPDVVLVGEIRDVQTVAAVLSAVEGGRFVMSTLHTTDAAETVNRILGFFPQDEQKQVRNTLAAVLRGVVCQRLVPRADGRGRVCVTEICVNTGRVAEAIADPDKTATITDLIADGAFYGMRTFDQHLVELVSDGVVSVDDAMAAASKPHDLSVELRKQGRS